MSVQVTFLNPQTCGIYKNGGVRFKTDPATGLRTSEEDNELEEAVALYLHGKVSPGQASIPVSEVFDRQVLVPTYYDTRYDEAIHEMTKKHRIETISIGELLDTEIISVRNGHGSPSNDQRIGTIPYVKVSDIRGLRINVNPTNLVSSSVAKRFWKSNKSGLRAWDVITPNRASSNIGEFAILLPGEEQIVITKEVFIFRTRGEDEIWDPFFLLWCLSLKAVRDQWHRIALMQTNREDCGLRYREILLPKPPSVEWAQHQSRAFREYFESLSDCKQKFLEGIIGDEFEYIASVSSSSSTRFDGFDG